MKKTLSIILAILMIVTTIPMAFAADIEASGAIGGSLDNGFSWTFDSSTGCLKIIGEGDMPSIDAYKLWESYNDSITSIEIAEGITSISDSAFNALRAITSVSIPNTVTRIEQFSFGSATLLKSVVVSSNITSISASAFGVFPVTKIHYCGNKGDFTLDNTGVYEFEPVVHYCEETAVVDATCTEGGYEAGWYCASCSKYVEGREAIPALNHKGTLVQVDAKANTCTEIGWDAYEYCTACDYTTYVEKAALNHKGTLVQVDAKANTCTEIGWDAYEYCTACDYTTYVEKAALGHDIVIDAYVAPKCTQTGLTAGQHCSRCDDMTIVQEVIPDLGGHINEDGNTTCDRCGETILCEDCGRPVHDNTFVQKLICLIIMFINLVKSMFA